MDKCISRLTVFFEDPFWVGLYEREWNDRYEVCKITFGAEPKDNEVYEFLLKNWSHLKFSPSIHTETAVERRINPKRMQRIIRNQASQGIGTKAQQALKLEQEQRKEARKRHSKEQKEAEAERRFELSQQKRKAKHKGR